MSCQSTTRGKIPSGYRLMAHKWSYPEERLGETVELDGERIKKMLTLDLNIPNGAFAETVNMARLGEATQAFKRNYPCVHQCPGCFNNAELHNPIMTLDEVTSVVEQAQALGLESVKFLGPGELLMNPELFRILNFFEERNIVIGIFTKAALLGNDKLAMQYQRMSSEELVRKLTSYKHTNFYVGSHSFDPRFENMAIPQNKREFSASSVLNRNLAIERLCRTGLNTNHASTPNHSMQSSNT